MPSSIVPASDSSRVTRAVGEADHGEAVAVVGDVEPAAVGGGHQPLRAAQPAGRDQHLAAPRRRAGRGRWRRCWGRSHRRCRRPRRRCRRASPRLRRGTRRTGRRLARSTAIRPRKAVSGDGVCSTTPEASQSSRRRAIDGEAEQAARLQALDRAPALRVVDEQGAADHGGGEQAAARARPRRCPRPGDARPGRWRTGGSPGPGRRWRRSAAAAPPSRPRAHGGRAGRSSPGSAHSPRRPGGRARRGPRRCRRA